MWWDTAGTGAMLAQAADRPDSPAVAVVIALVLVGGTIIAALMSSKRGHRD